MADDGITITLKSSAKPKAVRLWSAHSETKDFRASEWSSKPVEAEDGGGFIGRVVAPDGGHIAGYLEAEFGLGPAKFSLCTQIWTQ